MPYLRQDRSSREGLPQRRRQDGQDLQNLRQGRPFSQRLPVEGRAEGRQGARSAAATAARGRRAMFHDRAEMDVEVMIS